ncbi:heterokaryon incompatibility protein-domain-containing protein [Lophiotrema nucula]|uniref:Heterokaryon incompatibility protein-domain-containing protein n=1 Tax=Lophiotrema nucula TaxID=690887 RepID=A0A6A5YNY1_9PLEO|nr:heterokaryon incompatibility protein-domain-containing protein [Lophiotrema nucula]
MPLRKLVTAVGLAAIAYELYQEHKRQNDPGHHLLSPRESERIQSLAKAAPASMAELYKDLQVANREIRVLVLAPGELDKPLVATMEVVPFTSATYEALSYCWGVDVRDKPLRVNGVEYWITSSLDIALRHLRPREGLPRRLWIDAVCIDQARTEEGRADKKAQLPRMGMIYNNAKKVIAWLGPSTKDSEDAFQFFSSFFRTCTDISDLNRSYDTERARWQHFENDILGREWWGRAWIVQEFIMSCEIEFHCGFDTMSENEMTMLGYFFHMMPFRMFESQITNPQEARNRRSIAILAATRAQKRSREIPDDLCYWVSRFHSWDCRDKLDHIYAFVGIAEENHFPVEPEREDDWPSVYGDLAYYILSTRKRVDFLCMGRGEDRSARIPASWVPDLQIKYDARGPMLPPLECSADAVYRASGGSFSGTIFCSSDKSTLTLSGIRFSGIKAMTGAHSRGFLSMDESRSLLRNILGTRVEKNAYPFKMSHTYAVAFARTLCWDLNWVRKRCGNNDTALERQPQDPPPTDYKPFITDSVMRRAAFEADITTMMENMRANRRFALFENGAIGMVPRIAEPDDIVCILAGASVPMLLRPHGTDWMFVGECYVHGIMDGEFWSRHCRNLIPFRIV